MAHGVHCVGPARLRGLCAPRAPAHSTLRHRHQPLRVGEWPSRASSGIAISARTPSSRIGRSGSIFATSSIVFASTVSRSNVVGDLLREGLREERRVAHLERETDDRPPFGRHVLEHLARAVREPPPRSARARRGSAGTSSPARARAPPTACRPRPTRRRRVRAARTTAPSCGPNSPTRARLVGGGQLRDGEDAETRPAAWRSCADSPELDRRPCAHHLEPVARPSAGRRRAACRIRSRPWRGPACLRCRRCSAARSAPAPPPARAARTPRGRR